MDSLPDLDTFDIFRPRTLAPDLDRVEAALIRSEAIAAGLAAKFPANTVFANHLAATRSALARIPEARACATNGDRHRLEVICGELADLFIARGRESRLAELGLIAE